MLADTSLWILLAGADHPGYGATMNNTPNKAKTESTAVSLAFLFGLIAFILFVSLLNSL